MSRGYWLGLAFFFIGLGLLNVPSGDYKLFTVIAGCLVQLAGLILMLRSIFQARRQGEKTRPRSLRLFIILFILSLVLGLAAGFFLVVLM
jgi:drug/metabolite transporter (DMT)-like permease